MASGSKTPAITTLLEKTLDIKRDLFCNLLLEIVRRGIKYTNNQITREEIEELNQLIEKVGFKIPELWDSEFLTSFPSEVKTPSEKSKKVNKEDLKRLERELIRISEIKDQSRGFAFERYLNELFRLFDLEPRSSFRIVGEQIDGSIQLDGQTYLVEAKWQNKQTGQADLLTFKGK